MDNKKFLTFFQEVTLKAAWVPTSVFLLMVVLLVFNMFTSFPDIDIPMHLLGGFAIAYFFSKSYLIAEKFNLIGNPAKTLQSILVFALGSTTAVLWEFAEFISDRIINTQLQGDLNDTLLDMLLGMVGIFLLLLLSRKKM